MTTNREKLAKMTNEELARFFEKMTSCKHCPTSKSCRFGISCLGTFLKWLEETNIITNEYKGFYYEIKNNDLGCHYQIYEYTPIAKQKHVIMSGSDQKHCSFSTTYVENKIEEILEDLPVRID